MTDKILEVRGLTKTYGGEKRMPSANGYSLTR